MIFTFDAMCSDCLGHLPCEDIIMDLRYVGFCDFIRMLWSTSGLIRVINSIPDPCTKAGVPQPQTQGAREYKKRTVDVYLILDHKYYEEYSCKTLGDDQCACSAFHTVSEAGSALHNNFAIALMIVAYEIWKTPSDNRISMADNNWAWSLSDVNSYKANLENYTRQLVGDETRVPQFDLVIYLSKSTRPRNLSAHFAYKGMS